jgi:hypothetical protein
MEMKMAAKRADVVVHSTPSNFVLVELCNGRARRWVKQHVQTEDWQWHGDTFSVDQHYIEDLLDGMAGFGLRIKMT